MTNQEIANLEYRALLLKKLPRRAQERISDTITGAILLQDVLEATEKENETKGEQSESANYSQIETKANEMRESEYCS